MAAKITTMLLLPAIACAEIPADKIGHFAAGAAAAAAVPIFIDHPKAPEFGLVTGAVLGIGKEIYDNTKPHKHTCEVKDFLATALGAYLVYKSISISVERSNGNTKLNYTVVW